MPRTIVTTQAATVLGINPLTLAGPPDVLGDVVDPDTYLEIKNGSGVSVTVTVQTPNTVQGVAIADVAIVIAAGNSALVRLRGDLYARDKTGADPGKVYVDYSAVTSVTRAAYAPS